MTENTTTAAPAATLGPLNDRAIKDAIRGAYELGYNDGKRQEEWAAYEVEQDHGGALIHTLSRRLAAQAAQEAEPAGCQISDPDGETPTKTALEIADDLMAEATMAANRANVSSDDYDISTTVRIAASTLRRQYARIAGYRAMLAAAPQAPAAPIAGLPIEQEPKYTVSGSHIVNRSSGEPVPRDEPVFVLRARDALSVRALEAYLSLISEREPASQHAGAVRGRIADFRRFAAEHTERMKWPDTAAPAPAAAVAPADNLTRFNPAHGSPETALQVAAVIAMRDEGRASAPTQEAEDAARYRTWRDNMIADSGPDFHRIVAEALPGAVGRNRRPTAAEWDAAIDAARARQEGGGA